jgi:hypothetical protein
MNDPQTIASTLEKIKVMQAFCDGKEIEFKEKIRDGNWTATNPNWIWSEYDYRVKPTPKLRAWTIDEVPLDAWYRHRLDESKYFRLEAISKKQEQLQFYNVWYNLLELQEYFQHSLDQGKTWSACGKEAV